VVAAAAGRWVLQRMHERRVRARVREILTPEETAQFVRFSEKATGWLLVAAGAGLIAVDETWNLRHAYEWPELVFWLLVAFMIVISVFFTAMRAKIRSEVLGLERRLRRRDEG
jgi:uncharacterized protein (DUF2236 family)